MSELQRRVQQFLMTAHLPALRHVGVEVVDDSVVLTGSVQSFYEKQMATEFARRVAGVVSVVNSIEVRLEARNEAVAGKPRLSMIRPALPQGGAMWMN